MLYITIKMNNNEVEYTTKHNTESYKDPFVNNKEKIYNAMVDTAAKLGCLDKGSAFKSLEFKTMTENFATIIYNSSKQLYVRFDSDSGVLCIHGIGYKVTTESLVMAFLLDNVIEDYK